MENGFTQYHSKGLFTFYREQAENPKITKTRLKTDIIEGQKSQRRPNKHYASLSTYENKKKYQKLSTSKQLEPKLKIYTSRYQQKDEQIIRKPRLTPRHIFEPKLIEKSVRKNGYILQLIGAKNRINRSEIEIYLKKQARLKNENRQLIGELSARQLPADQIKQLFLPKKEHYAKMHSLKKSPLKMNAITAHCVSQQNQREERMNEKNANDENGRQFYMPIHENKIHNKGTNLASAIFKDAFQLRRHKLESGSFWDQIKLKRQVPSIKLKEGLNSFSNLNIWSPDKHSHYNSVSSDNGNGAMEEKGND